MTAHDDASRDDATVTAEPADKAQDRARVDAADPDVEQRQRRQRVGSAGGGPYSQKPEAHDQGDQE